MRNGRYHITFTTDNGVLGDGVCLFQADKYVGVDFIHSYHGEVRYEGDGVSITMHCRRHGPDVVSQMDLPIEFDVLWRGEETDKGFRVETTLPGGKVKLSAIGIWEGGA